MARRKTAGAPLAEAPAFSESGSDAAPEAKNAVLGTRGNGGDASPDAADLAAGPALAPSGRRIWSPQVHQEAASAGRANVAHFWDEFLDGADACFWGLSYREGIMARRLASDVVLNEDLSRGESLNEEKFQLVIIAFSARGGDGSEYAYDPPGLPKTLLNPQEEKHLALIAGMGGARVTLLAQQIEYLSSVSMPRVAEHLGFFQISIRSLSEYTNTLIPSIIARLKNSSTLKGAGQEAAREAATDAITGDLLRMQTELRDLSASAETLLLGSSTVASTFLPRRRSDRNGS